MRTNLWRSCLRFVLQEELRPVRWQVWLQEELHPAEGRHRSLVLRQQLWLQEQLRL
ncbi:hypothetical protein AB1K70_22520 [Bremerella sp. JC770]|uniref:hypothetical protein n=1 Tax=Bremerella sp. JC770 TaxID=3232137 RepID=UPI003458B3FF